MATTKANTGKQRVRVSPATSPNAKALTGVMAQIVEARDSSPSEDTTEVLGDDEVVTNVATGFNLTLDDGSIKWYEAGANRMPRSHAEHWYAKAHGTTII